MGAFSYNIADYLYLQYGQTFVSDFSPSDSTVIQQTWSESAETLVMDSTLVTKHSHSLERLQCYHSLKYHPSTTFSVQWLFLSILEYLMIKAYQSQHHAMSLLIMIFI